MVAQTNVVVARFVAHCDGWVGPFRNDVTIVYTGRIFLHLSHFAFMHQFFGPLLLLWIPFVAFILIPQSWNEFFVGFNFLAGSCGLTYI
ncbi:MAG: hypothetical protein ACFFDT_30055 [Candidatus Hodarchaeota archaeon]